VAGSVRPTAVYGEPRDRGARGGVYLGGGIAPKIVNALSQGAFRQAFEAKGRMRSLLAPIPASVILAEFATLRGAAAGLRVNALSRRDL
jgi:glucokinase